MKLQDFPKHRVLWISSLSDLDKMITTNRHRPPSYSPKRSAAEVNLKAKRNQKLKMEAMLPACPGDGLWYCSSDTTLRFFWIIMVLFRNRSAANPEAAHFTDETLPTASQMATSECKRHTFGIRMPECSKKKGDSSFT
uniref:Uncharacterized protein n=1 Tax=Nothobranchius kuhntae TaxID=321403 RepID=A0A1A8KTX9_NOTKU